MQGRGCLGAVRKPSPASALLTGLLESSPATCEVESPQEKVGSVFLACLPDCAPHTFIFPRVTTSVLTTHL